MAGALEKKVLQLIDSSPDSKELVDCMIDIDELILEAKRRIEEEQRHCDSLSNLRQALFDKLRDIEDAEED